MKRLLLVLCVLASQVSGSPLSQEVAVERALEWMVGNPVMGAAGGRAIASVEVFPETGAYSVYVVCLSPTGYLVLNSDDRLPLMVSFSAESTVDLSDVPQNAFRAMLLRHVARMEEQLAQPIAMQAAAATVPLAVSELHGPFLETTWNQCNPYNKLCPEDPGGSEYYDYRVPVGCTPTAFAQVLQYHRWPFFGQGSRSYTDSLGSTTGPHSADFSNPYDWSAMLLSYDAWNPNPLGAEDAVSELMYELGVAAEANYESAGTSSSIQTLGQRLGEYYFFEPAENHSTTNALIVPMEADLRAGLPCVVAISNHAIVADGLMVDSGATTYHINYGWGGSNNGWWSADSIAGDPLEYGITSLRPQLLAFPLTHEVSGSAGESVEVQWILPKRREAEAGLLEIHSYNESSDSWELFWTDDMLASRRFSDVITPWDDCDDFSAFEVYSTSGDSKEWGISNIVDVGNCFSITPDGYGGTTDHLTSYSTITPTASTRLLLHARYRLGSEQFSVSVSTDRSSFTEIWSDSSTIDWSDIAIDLSTYAGQAIYVRLEYIPGGFYSDSGIWIDSISTQEVTNPELEGQPIHYTVLTNLPAGTHTLAAVLTDTGATEHAMAPSFTLTISGMADDGDGMPADWEQLYGLDTGINDAALDPDGDGYDNLQEYICKTIPTNAASCWLLEDGAGGRPSFYAWEDRLYTIQYRTGLVSGTWMPLMIDLPGSNGVVAISDYDSATNGTCFYRVDVRLED